MENKVNQELLEKARQAKTSEELAATAKENGIEMTPEEANTYFAQLNPKTGELADDELDSVAGGGCDGDEGEEHDMWHCCEHFVCVECGNNDPNCDLIKACFDCKYASSRNERNPRCTWKG